MYDFDRIIDRKGSGCVKYDGAGAVFGADDILPMWVADMDWATPDFIVEALRQRLEHPIFGYPTVPGDYFTTIASWLKELFSWDVDPSHIRYIPGIVKGVGVAMRCFLNPGDKVIIQEPVYHPFRRMAESMGYGVVDNPLVPVEGSEGFVCDYVMDFDALEKCIDERCRIMILCNPHNPAGICWSRDTLRRVAEICGRRGVLVVSDEIHGEMAFRGHLPYASVCPESAANSISFLAPSKTFNLAGIVSSYCIIPDAAVRERFFKYISELELDFPSIFSMTATRAAYTKGRQWRNEMLAYLQGNFDFVEDFLRNRIPRIRAMRPQASFLMWLDCRKLCLGQKDLVDLFVRKAGLGLNDGTMFGKGGEGFMRLNVGCPRSILKEALEHLEKAVASL